MMSSAICYPHLRWPPSRSLHRPVTIFPLPFVFEPRRSVPRATAILASDIQQGPECVTLVSFEGWYVGTPMCSPVSSLWLLNAQNSVWYKAVVFSPEGDSSTLLTAASAY